MSEYSDILFDPRHHTHTSCLHEIPNADMVILIVGSRFGGKAVPEALDVINLEKVIAASLDRTVLDEMKNLSVTQLEILKAVQESVPIFTFVDHKVWHDHSVYEKNKDLVDKIKFPSIDRPETAKYIFEFINFLRQRTKGNGVISFSSVEEIEVFLQRQWAALFQRLLREEKDKTSEERRINGLAEQLDELKTAVLSTIGDAPARDIAKGVVRYRRLIDFLGGIKTITVDDIVKSTDSFDSLLQRAGVIDTQAIPEGKGDFGRGSALILADGTFYESRFPVELIYRTKNDWEHFIKLPVKSREVIYEALTEMRGINPMILRYKNQKFIGFYEENSPKEEKKEQISPDIVIVPITPNGGPT